MKKLHLLMLILLVNNSIECSQGHIQSFFFNNNKTTIISLAALVGCALYFKRPLLEWLTPITKKITHLLSWPSYSTVATTISGIHMTFYGQSIASQRNNKVTIDGIELTIDKVTYLPWPTCSITVNGTSTTTVSNIFMPFFGLSITVNGNTVTIGNTTVTIISPQSNQPVQMQNANKKITKIISYTGIHTINAWGTGKLTIKCDPNKKEQMMVTAKKNIIDLLVKLENETLSCGPQEDIPYAKNLDISYTVFVKTLNNLSIRGVLKTTLENKTQTDKLTVTASGIATLDGEINTKKLILNCSGVNHATLHGNACTQNITLSGTRHFNGQKLVSKAITITASGTTQASLSAPDTIHYDISDVSQITYHGNPILTRTGQKSIVATIQHA